MKNKTNNLLLTAAIFLFLFLSVHSVTAQGLQPVGPTDFGTLIGDIVTWIFNIAIPISVLMVIWAGVIMLTSAGNESKYTKGKQYLKYAILGLTVVLIGRGFISLIQSVLEGSAGDISEPPGITLVVPTITPQVFDIPPSVLYTPTPLGTNTPTPSTSASATPSKDISLPTSLSGFITYLYVCILESQPDSAGLNFWMDDFRDHQATFGGEEAVIHSYQSFYASTEFNNEILPSLTDAQLVTKLYNCNWFYRPDATEVQYWTDQMERGLSRQDTINSFLDASYYNRFTVNVMQLSGL